MNLSSPLLQICYKAKCLITFPGDIIQVLNVARVTFLILNTGISSHGQRTTLNIGKGFMKQQTNNNTVSCHSYINIFVILVYKPVNTKKWDWINYL